MIADTYGRRRLIDSSDSAAGIQTVPFPPVMSHRWRQVQRPSECLNLSLRILVPPVMKIIGRQLFNFFYMKQQDLGANFNIHRSVHVLLRSFDDFPQLLLRPYRNSENKTSANADGILFSLRGAEILLLGFRLPFWICYTEPYSVNFTKPTFVFNKFPGS